MQEWLSDKAFIAAAVLVLNLISFALYAADKRKAIKHRWRIPESALLTASLFGTAGALTGMYLLRHKTRKPKFYITVPLIFAAKLAALIFLLTKLI